MTPHENLPGPVTTAGAAVLRFLGSDTVANAGAMLRQGSATSEIAHQVLVVLARRKFARQDGVGARAYVERALAADGSATGRRVDAAEKMLVGKLAGHPRATLPLRDQDLVLLLAVDLARQLVPGRLPELVRAAEERLRWMLTHPSSRAPIRRLRFRGVSRELRATPEIAGPPLRTTAGEVLVALVRNDLNRAQRLADGTDLAPAEPVMHAAFAAAVRSCLASADNAAIRKVAVPIARRCSSVLISADVVEQMLRHELDPSAPPPDLGGDLRVEAEMSTVVSLAEWFGLLPSEVHDLIAAAER